MSLADTCDQLVWADLTAAAKKTAVKDQLVKGRSVEEAAELLSIIYGAVGTNHVRGVMDRHRLHEDRLVRGALRARRDTERAAMLARARAGAKVVKLRPAERIGAAGRAPVLPPDPLSVPLSVPQPDLPGKRRPTYVGLTLFQLTNATCRKPLWRDPAPAFEQKFFCGRPTVDGASFCASCAKALYREAGEDQ
ncbi:MAG: GcrA family cell cycle regulator [Roseibium sp.]